MAENGVGFYCQWGPGKEQTDTARIMKTSFSLLYGANYRGNKLLTSGTMVVEMRSFYDFKDEGRRSPSSYPYNGPSEISRTT